MRTSKSTKVIESPFNGIKLILAVGLILGLCLLLLLDYSSCSETEQCFFLGLYGFGWAFCSFMRVRRLEKRKKHHAPF